MQYVELCAGAGGTRLGLEQAGWLCAGSVDSCSAAALVHRMVFGECQLLDVKDARESDFSAFDVLVAGFPCQPFSSSGPRLGLRHPSGNVFENIARLAAESNPRFLILENVRGLLNHKGGDTFLVILRSLMALGYHVEWAMLDLAWLGVPQTRPRIFLVAHKESLGADAFNVLSMNDGRVRLGCVFEPLIHWLDMECSDIHETRIAKVGESRRASNTAWRGFGTMGIASDGTVTTWSSRPRRLIPLGAKLGKLVAPTLASSSAIRSVRYYARRKGTKLHVRRSHFAHCVGNVPGSAPMFCVPASHVQDPASRKAFLRDGNWHREEKGYLVVRMAPEHAVRLFGPYTKKLGLCIAKADLTQSEKYLLVANLVAPVCSRLVATLVDMFAARQHESSGLLPASDDELSSKFGSWPKQMTLL